MTIIRTLISRILLILIIIVFFVPLLIFMYMPKRWRYNRFIFWFVNLFYWLVLKSSLIPITFEGWENLPNEPVIFAANHQSSLDVPLVGVLARSKPHIWLARHELMESWLLRWILPHGAVVINVSSPKKAVRSLMYAIDLAKDTGSDLMIFPEGQRYIDGDVHDFFRGFVILAKKTKRPLVPVRIFGVHKVYPPNTFWVRYYPIKVVIGKPFVYQDTDTDDSFKDRVYQWFVDQKE